MEIPALFALLLSATVFRPLPADAAESDRLSLAQGAWTPTATQIEQALTAVERFVALKDAPSLWAGKQKLLGGPETLRGRDLRRYYVRARGIIGSDPQHALAADVNGKPMVEMYAFCEVRSDAWKSVGYYIWDGGDCYFDALYDPSTKAVVSLRVNGN